MLLRSITKHLKEQNWFAVGLDFFIVVVGVFIGIQVANWNEEQTFHDRETALLHELKKEVQASIILTNHRVDTFGQVVGAGRRSLNFITSNVSCGTECWPILVDFMHASQWQDIRVRRSTYDLMRNLGLPRNGTINEEMEAYLAQNDAAIPTFKVLPYYRDVVRQLVPFHVQEFYWPNCFSVIDGIESYNLDCPKGISDDIALQIVELIAKHPEIKPHLTQWVSTLVLLPITFSSQNSRAEQAIAAIDAELERR